MYTCIAVKLNVMSDTWQYIKAILNFVNRALVLLMYVIYEQVPWYMNHPKLMSTIIPLHLRDYLTVIVNNPGHKLPLNS